MKFGDAPHDAFHREGFARQGDLAGLDLGEVEDVGQHLLQQAA
mgnify:CR=1 FL=1